MNRLSALAGTALSLVGLYLVLTNAWGTAAVLRAVGSSTASIFRTLQGR